VVPTACRRVQGKWGKIYLEGGKAWSRDLIDTDNEQGKGQEKKLNQHERTSRQGSREGKAQKGDAKNKGTNARIAHQG